MPGSVSSTRRWPACARCWPSTDRRTRRSSCPTGRDGRRDRRQARRPRGPLPPDPRDRPRRHGQRAGWPNAPTAASSARSRSSCRAWPGAPGWPSAWRVSATSARCWSIRTSHACTTPASTNAAGRSSRWSTSTGSRSTPGARRRLDVRARLRLFVQVVRAVAYAHGRLVMHRDLKPANVLVNADGQAHLLDFGIAKLLDEAAPRERPDAGTGPGDDAALRLARASSGRDDRRCSRMSIAGRAAVRTAHRHAAASRPSAARWGRSRRRFCRATRRRPAARAADHATARRCAARSMRSWPRRCSASRASVTPAAMRWPGHRATPVRRHGEGTARQRRLSAAQIGATSLGGRVGGGSSASGGSLRQRDGGGSGPARREGTAARAGGQAVRGRCLARQCPAGRSLARACGPRLPKVFLERSAKLVQSRFAGQPESAG